MINLDLRQEEKPDIEELEPFKACIGDLCEPTLEEIDFARNEDA